MLATTLAVSAWSPFVTMTLLPYWLHSFREIPFFLFLCLVYQCVRDIGTCYLISFSSPVFPSRDLLLSIYEVCEELDSLSTCVFRSMRLSWLS
jgi:hypothetical protein